MHLETLLSRLEMQMNMWKSRPWTRFSAQRLRSFSLNQEVDVPRPAHQSLRKRTRKWASGQVGGCSSALLFPLPSKDNYEPRDSPPPPLHLKACAEKGTPPSKGVFMPLLEAWGKHPTQLSMPSFLPAKDIRCAAAAAGFLTLSALTPLWNIRGG